MSTGKTVGVVIERPRLIRTKFKSYRTTEWMNNVRLNNVFLALTDMDMTYPTSYDMVIADLKRLMGELPSSLDSWTCVSVNTDHSSGSGYHYNHVTYGIDTNGVPRASFLEPLRNTSISEHLATELKKVIPSAETVHYSVGCQRNGSSCGYYSGWWQLHCQGLVVNGCAPLKWTNPPKLPDGWERVCCRLFTIFDMQAEIPSALAKDIGLRPLFTKAVSSGVFNEGAFFTVIDEYASKLQDEIELAAAIRA